MKRLLIIYTCLLFTLTYTNHLSAEGPVSNDYCAIVYTSNGESKNFVNIHDAWEYADANLNQNLFYYTMFLLKEIS